MASNNTRARKRARAESIPEESVDETQNLKQKLDIQSTAENCPQRSESENTC